MHLTNLSSHWQSKVAEFEEEDAHGGAALSAESFGAVQEADQLALQQRRAAALRFAQAATT